jgi:hypothetical protein
MAKNFQIENFQIISDIKPDYSPIFVGLSHIRNGSLYCCIGYSSNYTSLDTAETFSDNITNIILDNRNTVCDFPLFRSPVAHLGTSSCNTVNGLLLLSAIVVLLLIILARSQKTSCDKLVIPLQHLRRTNIVTKKR